jgi:hypothetical protein
LWAINISKDMNFNTERLQYGNRGDKHIKKIGRFSATDLYGIIKGKTTPEEFLNRPQMDEKGSLNCLRGDTIEYGVSQVWKRSGAKFDTQVKREIIVDDLTFVAVADFHFGDKILECKSPEKFTGQKDYNKYQCELQYRIFNVPIYIGYYNFIDGNLTEQGSYLYAPNERLWQTIQRHCKDFNELLKRYDASTHSSGSNK